MAVAIVDDDDLFRESLRLNLEDEGFAVEDFSNGLDALRYLAGHHDIGVVLLDWKMPEIDGLAVLHRLRAAGNGVPVIFLTVLSDEIYEEAALEGGAVDFVEKSRSFSIVLKRIALIESGAKTPGVLPSAEPRSETMAFGALVLWPHSKRVVWRDKTVELTVREFDIVAMMTERRGHNVTYRDIYDTVHGKGFLAGDGNEGLRNTVRAIIKRIRQKFRAVDSEFDVIENYPGFGYRWRGDGHDG
ncbi:response regulator transcription factor [Govanella unica]|uniref:Response regulator transcription factor n=1 Tax=Govanella unica TaxID=2975056 RepID=A0A9X3TVH9_9PROT|nr:response regulator transcription factor [Govania unica]MDA5192462.1 response regulator transcription factor [Govania unica]